MSMTPLNACGCCAGLDVETPAQIDNPPGLPAIAYRAGVHARFKRSLLAKLSSAALPQLAGLSTRDDGDFTIALCDAVASALDVLSFYQERIANENYLRTAIERRSILELARLIGYELAPGVAASTWLAFTLQDVPGMPALAAEPVMLPVGIKVQSVPGPGELPQTFETVEKVEARVEWNAIPIRSSERWRATKGATFLWLAGLNTGVKPGDAILIIGEGTESDASAEGGDLRLVLTVAEDRHRQCTRIGWNGGLEASPGHVRATVHVFGLRAALFGHNAPDPSLLSTEAKGILADGQGVPPTGWQWKGYAIEANRIDLDAAYPTILPDSWIALVSSHPKPVPPASLEIAAAPLTVVLAGDVPRPPGGTALGYSIASSVARQTARVSPGPGMGTVHLSRLASVTFCSQSRFGLSGKVTRVVLHRSPDPKVFGIRETLVLAQSAKMEVADTLIGYPLYGKTLELSRSEPDIVPGRALAVSGKRARIRIRAGKPDATLNLTEGGSVTVSEGDSLRLGGPPEELAGSALAPDDFAARMDLSGSNELRLTVLDRDGNSGSLKVSASAIELMPALEDDEVVQEIAFIEKPSNPPATEVLSPQTIFTLTGALKHCYDRETVRVNANVARATHGETVAEVLGSGDARVANASFALRQSPLTYVSAATPSGRQSTLELRANDMRWNEVPSLYARGATERAYRIVNDDEGRSRMLFGDGVEGARLPSGDHNVRAVYRKGLGLAGNVAAGKLTTLLTRPLGLSGASNPEPAGGGEDAETLDRARENAPLTVLTLDRAVSVQDYQDYARAFAGIAKAHALWIPNGPARGVFITVAGENGVPVAETGDTYRFLLNALHRYGDPLMPARIASYRAARFRTHLAVKVAAAADAALVLPAVEVALRSAFGFAARGFGQGASVDEVAAVAQSVTGVEAVQVVELHRFDVPTPVCVPRLFAALPVPSLTKAPAAAELLFLDDGPIQLEQMP